MPTFSIITANYNSGTKLEATSSSVLSQGDAVEYIIMDGGSYDDSFDIANGLVRQYSERVHLISESDRGIYHAMNKAVSHAKGRYLMFLGAGDVLCPGILSELLGHLPAHNMAMIYGDVFRDEQRHGVPLFPWSLAQFNPCHQSIFYGRDVFHTLGGYDEKYRRWADYEFNMKCFGRSDIEKKYIKLPIAVYEGGGVSDATDLRFIKDKAKLVRRHLGLRTYLGMRRKELKSMLYCRSVHFKSNWLGGSSEH